MLPNGRIRTDINNAENYKTRAGQVIPGPGSGGIPSCTRGGEVYILWDNK